MSIVDAHGIPSAARLELIEPDAPRRLDLRAIARLLGRVVAWVRAAVGRG